VLISKPAEEEHDRGALETVRFLLGSGFEVIYCGNVLDSQELVYTAKREKVTAIGFSIGRDEHKYLVENTRAQLDAEGMNIALFGGGYFGSRLAKNLERKGVKLFSQNTTVNEMLGFINTFAAQAENQYALAHSQTSVRLTPDIFRLEIGTSTQGGVMTYSPSYCLYSPATCGGEGDAYSPNLPWLLTSIIPIASEMIENIGPYGDEQSDDVELSNGRFTLPPIEIHKLPSEPKKIAATEGFVVRTSGGVGAPNISALVTSALNATIIATQPQLKITRLYPYGAAVSQTAQIQINAPNYQDIAHRMTSLLLNQTPPKTAMLSPYPAMSDQSVMPFEAPAEAPAKTSHASLTTHNWKSPTIYGWDERGGRVLRSLDDTKENPHHLVVGYLPPIEIHKLPSEPKKIAATEGFVVRTSGGVGAPNISALVTSALNATIIATQPQLKITRLYPYGAAVSQTAQIQINAPNYQDIAHRMTSLLLNQTPPKTAMLSPYPAMSDQSVMPFEAPAEAPAKTSHASLKLNALFSVLRVDMISEPLSTPAISLKEGHYAHTMSQEVLDIKVNKYDDSADLISALDLLLYEPLPPIVSVIPAVQSIYDGGFVNVPFFRYPQTTLDTLLPDYQNLKTGIHQSNVSLYPNTRNMGKTAAIKSILKICAYCGKIS
jgi:methylmalonyl-CoA mutase cobalamin-binding domain/chain